MKRRRRRTVLRDGPHPIDVHVGRRVRERRILVGLSQEELGRKIDLTFQQVQKYEWGSNRISASRLWEISQVLRVPVEWFFIGLDNKSDDEPDIETRRQTLEAARFFDASPTGVRTELLSLMKATASITDPDPGD